MLDRYTKKAQQALSLAENTAEELGHNYIGTEHILVGLLEEGTGVAGRLLEAYGVREDKVLDLIRRLIAPSNTVSLQEPQRYSPSATAVLENSYIEARRFKSQLIGTEHILIAMLKKGRLFCYTSAHHYGSEYTQTICRSSCLHRAGCRILQR